MRTIVMGLRWLAFVPSALLAAFFVEVVMRLTLPILWDIPFIADIARGAFSASAFVLTAAKVAPSSSNWVQVASGFLAVLFGLLISYGATLSRMGEELAIAQLTCNISFTAMSLLFAVTASLAIAREHAERNRLLHHLDRMVEATSRDN